MDLDTLLWEAVDRGASDLHLRAGSPPMLRVDGEIEPVEDEPALTPADTRAVAKEILEDHQVNFEAMREIDVGYAVRELGRFRVNVFTNSGQIGIVLRIMPPEPLGLAELNLPEVLSNVAEANRGLVLVTGVTGSGKSTTLAAMIDHINRNRCRHIITIEDPIEYVHVDRDSLVTQRQLGLDTNSFADALRAALRQDPDVILIGEMRDRETIDAAVLAAETGHLVFSTLHTVDAPETLNRILATYPPYQQEQVRTQLADVMRAVVSQRLLNRINGEGLVPAVEVLINSKFVSECIRDATRTSRIREAMADGGNRYGMQTFDQSILSLCQRELISEEVAIAAATVPSDLKLQLRGIVSGIDPGRGTQGAGPSRTG
ncbi:MAG TPA: type IV pilus twitching motility protein PilT [Acidobacteriota bacterium]|nr:type IV pilus twitching motility protein PilT [Acidobacteriota bacterium]